MNYDKLQKKLKDTIITESDYQRALVKIGMFSPELIKAFEHYIETDEIPLIAVDEWSIDKIMQKVGCNELQAFFNMDILMKNDEFRKNFKYMQFGRK